MLRARRKGRLYLGPVILGPQPRKWIKHPSHKSFASKEWLEGRVRYGEWIRDQRNPGTDDALNFLIYDFLVEHKSTVIIKITYYRNSHVYVEHVHLRRRRH